MQPFLKKQLGVQIEYLRTLVNDGHLEVVLRQVLERPVGRGRGERGQHDVRALQHRLDRLPLPSVKLLPQLAQLPPDAAALVLGPAALQLGHRGVDVTPDVAYLK